MVDLRYRFSSSEIQLSILRSFIGMEYEEEEE